MQDNIILMTDSYKASHAVQYPPKTTKVYSYFESRGGKYDNVVFFGLQYILKRYLAGKVVTQEKIEEAAKLWAEHFGNAKLFNRDGWQYILDKHDGKLPLKIRAVPEGTVVSPTGNVLMTVENTDPACFWLTNYMETILSQVWYSCTVATQSRHMRRIILKYLKETGDPSSIWFKLHDFGYRGVSSNETAAIGGAAHLINFKGTDTVAGIRLVKEYYHDPMPGFSIPASEHSTITSWGEDHEVDAMQNMLEQYPTGLVACVSDSFDIFKACSELWGNKLRDKILSRDGTLVIRPDSGDPCEVLPKIMDILYQRFGGEVNTKGYKEINSKVRIIQGDGVDVDSLETMLDAVKKAGFSANNLAFGSGGGLLQKVNRDTQKFAFKCSMVVVDGQERDVYKSPITDPGKNSKRGTLCLYRTIGDIYYNTVEHGKVDEGEMSTVFIDGDFIGNSGVFMTIRERARQGEWR